jgi:REP element-mobilizing transposase RayT
MSNVYARLVFHVVFSTKDREPLITEDVQARLYEYMGGVLREVGGRLIEIGGTEDHVHLLVELRPSMQVAEAVGKVKGASSRWLDQQSWFGGGFSWQRGYAAFTVSRSLERKVAGYVRGQRSHHRAMSFTAELEKLLSVHGISGSSGVKD